MDIDITNKLQRLEAFEERLGVRLEAIFGPFSEDDQCFWVQGEIHPREGVHLNQNIELVLDVLDDAGRVVAITEHLILKDRFYGFESFRLMAFVACANVSKIRLYPRS